MNNYLRFLLNDLCNYLPLILLCVHMLLGVIILVFVMLGVREHLTEFVTTVFIYVLLTILSCYYFEKRN